MVVKVTHNTGVKRVMRFMGVTAVTGFKRVGWVKEATWVTQVRWVTGVMQGT